MFLNPEGQEGMSLGLILRRRKVAFFRGETKGINDATFNLRSLQNLRYDCQSPKEYPENTGGAQKIKPGIGPKCEGIFRVICFPQIWTFTMPAAQ